MGQDSRSSCVALRSFKSSITRAHTLHIRSLLAPSVPSPKARCITIEVRVAPCGRDGRDHIPSIWEIRHGDPKDTVSALKYHNVILLHLHNYARFCTAAHCQCDRARLPILPVLLIIIGLCLLVTSYM